jgi:microcystin-dependent protein
LGIKTGDSLSYVEQALIGFLTSTLNGEGITLDINPAIICDIVKKNLIACEDLTLPNVISALIKAICELDERLTELEADFAALEGPYTIGCLTGVTSTSGTHAILQAAITKICGLEVELDALALDVSTNYVQLANLNTLIAAYLASISGGGTNYNTRMVPFTVVEYYGSLTGNFDATGAGLGLWDKIYLCNGNNGTPDKRGRVPVGVTSGMGGGALSPVVDPALGNPAYALLGAQGTNSVVLTTNQIPSHTHPATAVSTPTDPGHTHTLKYKNGFSDPDESGAVPDYMDQAGTKSASAVTEAALTGITVATTVTVASAGGGLSHPNFQPGLGCYYIMYIP